MRNKTHRKKYTLSGESNPRHLFSRLPRQLPLYTRWSPNMIRWYYFGCECYCWIQSIVEPQQCLRPERTGRLDDGRVHQISIRPLNFDIDARNPITSQIRPRLNYHKISSIWQDFPAKKRPLRPPTRARWADRGTLFVPRIKTRLRRHLLWNSRSGGRKCMLCKLPFLCVFFPSGLFLYLNLYSWSGHGDMTFTLLIQLCIRIYVLRLLTLLSFLLLLFTYVLIVVIMSQSEYAFIM